MSGAVVVTPSTGAAWATAWEQFEGIRKGLIALSLTEYDTTNVPQIAAGSWVEAIGSIYKWTGNDAIVGGLTANAINYITMVPSGAGAGAILTPTWSDTPPTWSDAYNGYFSGTTRYVGGCWYDGANYPLKWVYTNRGAGARTRYVHPIFEHTDDLANIQLHGWAAQSFAPGAGENAFANVSFPVHGRCIITEFETYCQAHTDGNHVLYLQRSIRTGAGVDILATTTHAGTGALVDTTIATPIVDLETYCYYVNYSPAANATGTISSIRVEFIEVVRC